MCLWIAVLLLVRVFDEMVDGGCERWKEWKGRKEAMGGCGFGLDVDGLCIDDDDDDDAFDDLCLVYYRFLLLCFSFFAAC